MSALAALKAAQVALKRYDRAFKHWMQKDSGGVRLVAAHDAAFGAMDAVDKAIAGTSTDASLKAQVVALREALEAITERYDDLLSVYADLITNPLTVAALNLQPDTPRQAKADLKAGRNAASEARAALAANGAGDDGAPDDGMDPEQRERDEQVRRNREDGLI